MAIVQKTNINKLQIIITNHKRIQTSKNENFRLPGEFTDSQGKTKYRTGTMGTDIVHEYVQWAQLRHVH